MVRPDRKLRVTAKFEKYPAPKEVLIPNVLGGEFKMQSPGLLRFKLNGKPITLEQLMKVKGSFLLSFAI